MESSRPYPRETIQQYIDRVIVGKDRRWVDPHTLAEPIPSPTQFFEPSYVRFAFTQLRNLL